jgi:metal-responsive CopG/Arc/MetJ family transcriptional regulator
MANIILLYDPNMPSKPVQISLDTDLLDRVDADAETRERGRSAFVRAAIEQYLKAKERRRIDARIVAAYQGQAEAAMAEIADFMDVQAWPED